MNKKKITLLSLALVGFAYTQAQTLLIKGQFKGQDTQALSLYAKPMNTSIVCDAVKMKAQGETFEVEVPASADGFYNIFGNYKGSQLIVPMYLTNATDASQLVIEMDGACAKVSTGVNNQALSAFNQVTFEKGRDFWQDAKTMSDDALKSFIKSFDLAADSIAKAYQVADPVKDYIKLWAYASARNIYESIPHAKGIKGSEVGFKISEVQPKAEEVFDTPMSALFPQVEYSVFRTIPKGELNERLAWLFEHYSTDVVRKNVAKVVTEDFVRTFDFSGDFNKGLADLTQATEKYGVDESFLQEFKKRQSSAKGAAFPAGVKLVDVNGKEVDFARFKGKYVYVDLWASWCAPCCKEVPFLQRLEANMVNKDVVFVSISIDKNETAWRNKMKQLNMHGNQFLNQDESLGTALNVRGIPFFVIYDKEGKLYLRGAPRPSNTALQELLEGLK